MANVTFPKQQVDDDSSDRTSFFGTPVFSNMEIPSGKYKTLDGQTVNFEGIRVDAVLFVVSQSKNIVTTAVNGQNGTVKEYISDGDFMITATGMIVGESSESGRTFSISGNSAKYPETDVRRLIEILKCPQSIEIVSDYLDYFEIRDVVIESFSMEQQEGNRRAQQFTLQMMSDSPIELFEI